MPLRLRQDLHCCVSGGRTIFLDVETDRYFCLSPSRDEVFQRFLAGESGLTGLGLFVDLGILVEGQALEGSGCVEAWAMPCSELAPDSGSPPGLAMSVRALLARLVAAGALRRRGFADVCRGIVARRAASGPEASTVNELSLRVLARALSQTDLIFGRTKRCLPRSLAFMALCHSCRVYPKLVIGVRTHPFAAHCWVQLGDRVLNDTIDNVRIFSPIMAL
jgi:hypothetical protein